MQEIRTNERVVSKFNDGTYILKTKIINSKGNAQYRTYHVCEKCGKKVRLDHIITQSNHQCQIQNQTVISNYFKGFDTTKVVYYKFICKTNISLKSAVSKELYTLLEKIFNDSQHLIMKQLPDSIKTKIILPQFKDYFPIHSRQKLSKDIIEFANNVRDVTLSNLHTYKYVSFSLDGGSLNTVPVLDIILQNPYFRGKPLLIEARNRFTGTRECYIDIIKNVIENKVAPRDLKIASFNGDNLAAQKSAFNDADDSILKKNDLSKVCGGALYFPCVCHVTALGFKDCIRGTPLDEITSKIQNITKMFRSKPIQPFFETICPPYCPTRWTNCFSIAKWLLDNRMKILSVFRNAEATPKIKAFMSENKDFPVTFTKYIPIFYSMLYTYNAFVTVIEGDRVSAAHIWPLFNQFKEQSILVVSVVDNLEIDSGNYIKDLVECISIRLQNTYSAELLKFIYYLTPKGRLNARQEMREKGINLDNDFIDNNIKNLEFDNDEEFNLEINTDELKHYLTNCKRDLSSIQAELRNAFDCLNHGSSFPAIERDDYEEEIEEEPLSEDAASDGTGVLDCSFTDIYNYIEKRAKTIVKSETANPEELITYPLKMVSFYRNWISREINEMWNVDLYLRNSWKYWKELGIHDKRWAPFADFAMRHLSIVANSAACERAFWREARIVPPDRMNSSTDLILSRFLISTME